MFRSQDILCNMWILIRTSKQTYMVIIKHNLRIFRGKNLSTMIWPLHSHYPKVVVTKWTAPYRLDELPGFDTHILPEMTQNLPRFVGLLISFHSHCHHLIPPYLFFHLFSAQYIVCPCCLPVGVSLGYEPHTPHVGNPSLVRAYLCHFSSIFLTTSHTTILLLWQLCHLLP